MLLFTKVDTIGSAMIRTKVDIRVEGIQCLKSRVLTLLELLTPIESQQDNAPAHHQHEAVELLSCGTPKFIASDMWLPSHPDVNQMITAFGY